MWQCDRYICCSVLKQVVVDDETNCRLKTELAEVEYKSTSAGQTAVDLQKLLADIEQANVKVTVEFMLPSLHCELSMSAEYVGFNVPLDT